MIVISGSSFKSCLSDNCVLVFDVIIKFFLKQNIMLYDRYIKPVDRVQGSVKKIIFPLHSRRNVNQIKDILIKLYGTSPGTSYTKNNNYDMTGVRKEYVRVLS